MRRELGDKQPVEYECYQNDSFILILLAIILVAGLTTVAVLVLMEGTSP